MDQDIANVSQKEITTSSVTLTEKDIEGASLTGRHPTKLTIQELKFWLSCRAIRHTKLKTKAELVARVLEVSDSNLSVVDPTKDLLYTKRKQSEQSSSVGSKNNGVTTPASVITQPASDWGRVIPPGLSFNDIHIHDYSLNSGKRALKLKDDQPRKKTCIRPETRGYRFFSEKYLHDIWCSADDEHIHFKARCFPSQRKNDDAHKIWCAISKKKNFMVDMGHCTCVAGNSGYCNHVIALLYQISHFAKSAVTVIPDDISKTSQPMTWQKPRVEGVAAEPIMNVSVNPTSQNRDFPCTLYEARTRASQHIVGALLSSVQDAMGRENRYGITMVRNNTSDTVFCRTQLGTLVPLGSPLSYQLALTEGDYHVDCNIVSVDRFQCTQSCVARDMESYPNLPMCETKPPLLDSNLLTDQGRDVLKKLAVDSVKSNDIERETRDQAGSDRWWEERQLRVTASKFSEVTRRKQANSQKFVQRLQQRPDSETKKMPMSLRHGRDYEHVATRKYHKYMSNIGHKVEVRPSGLVVREDFPHLGASPDGKVLDPVAHPHFGILEVKCPYKYRGVRPREAAKIDKDFCLGISDYGHLSLKKTHAYFCEVQGQMLLTGASWCDFVVYSFKGLHIERIAFDEEFCGSMLTKLNTFYFKSYLTYAKI